MKKILIANLASPANPGDQAILMGTLKVCREVFDRPEVTVSTRAYSQRAVFEAMGCRVVPSYPDVEALSMDDSFRKVFRIPAALRSPGKFRNAVREADMIFLAGGAYFYSYRRRTPGFTYLAHVSASWWARKYSRPVILLPQSYGPFASEPALRLFDQVAGRARHIYYRENLSGEFLRKRYGEDPKISFMPDLALYLKRADILDPAVWPLPPGKPAIGVTVRPWSAGGPDESGYLQALAEALAAAAAEKDLVIRLIVQVRDDKKTEGDEGVTRRLEKMLTGKLGREKVEMHTADPYFSIPQLCRLYDSCEMLISMRLHSALLAFILGKPALVAGYQHKAQGILRRLGLEELYLGSFADVSSAMLKQKLEEVWPEREAWKEKIRVSLDHARQQILNGFREAAA